MFEILVVFVLLFAFVLETKAVFQLDVHWFWKVLAMSVTLVTNIAILFGIWWLLSK